MQSRCSESAYDSASVGEMRATLVGYVKALTVSVSAVALFAIVFCSQDALADSQRDESCVSSGAVLMAQAQSENAGSKDEKSGTTSGGSSGSSQSGMSDRIRKYMGGDDGPVVPGRPPGGPGRGPGGEEMGGMRERMRERLQNLPPEKREQLMQEIKEHRMRKRGMSDGPDGEGMGGPEGPDGEPGPGPGPGPRFGGKGNGVAEYGFKRNMGRKNFRPPGDKGMKGGKFFGREPLDLTVLNLTAEQKAKIQSLRTADGQKARQLQSELRQRRDKLRDMLFDPAASSDQILSTQREINKLQSQTQDIILNDFLGIRKLLTKEQLELLPQVRPDDSRRPRLGQKPPPPPPDGGPRPPFHGDFDPDDR